MMDVLLATGNIWETLVRTAPQSAKFEVQILSTSIKPFRCGNRIPVKPDVSVADNPAADILIFPELWLGPDETLEGRYPQLMTYIRERHRAGTYLYSACSGALMLAASGLLDGRSATSHWGYADLFRDQYPEVQFRPEPNLCFADDRGQIVTAGGTSSWHDLAIHIIAKHVSPGEALRITKVYLLKWHDEGQLPYSPLVRNSPHGDEKIKACELWLSKHFCEAGVLRDAIQHAGMAERTLKRRFRKATNSSMLAYIQNLRIEEAKYRLESTRYAVDEISADVGYEDPAFFRRLFKRLTGLTPSAYRRLFQTVADYRAE